MADHEFTDLAEPTLAGPLTNDERTDTLILEQAVGVLSGWLQTHYSPHAMMVITAGPATAEVFEGHQRFSVPPPMMPTPVMPDHLG